MNVLISGGGIAGLTLAFWLNRLGQRPTVVERSPWLRDDGYMIDFFGPGYDVAEKMGLLADLQSLHHRIPRVVIVDAAGRERAAVRTDALRKLLDWRHFNFMRGELERLLHTTVADHVPVRFGASVASFDQDERQVHVRFADGTSGDFDLLVGADGLHSHVRQLAFGDESQFTRFLGYYTAAFILGEPLGPRDAFTTLSARERQVSIYPIPVDRTATFLIHKAHRVLEHISPDVAREELQTAYGDLGWVVPELLQRAQDVPDLYFDSVSQVVMPSWSAGRLTLVGDACGCVSLVAGQGASMAMAGAYILARELASGDDVAAALARYERLVRLVVEQKQRAGKRFARWVVPDTSLRVSFQAFSLRAAGWPVLAPVIKRQFGLGRGIKL
jgi:2-polyprenyl-6-methoxyphenol hydroxylase-like FAD-dependent oxidoreductase